MICKATAPSRSSRRTTTPLRAFEAANPGVLAGLSKGSAWIAILTYHVIAGAALEAGDLANGQLAKTLAGPVVAVDLSGDKPKINGATVIAADIAAENGVIHVIDEILLPGDIIEVATAAGDFTNSLRAHRGRPRRRLEGRRTVHGVRADRPTRSLPLPPCRRVMPCATCCFTTC